MFILIRKTISSKYLQNSKQLALNIHKIQNQFENQTFFLKIKRQYKNSKSITPLRVDQTFITRVGTVKL